jgi:excisionase family DNA binding protein
MDTPTAPTLDEWNSPSAVAAYLGNVPEGTLAQWRHRGIGPTYAKIGRHVRYRRSDVEAWAAAQIVESPRLAS